MYSEEVIDHFKHPRNMGKIENPNGIGKVGNAVCGDVMVIYIRVEDNRIADIGFEAMGCAAAIATSSMTTELARGKTLEEAEKITNKSVAESLGGLPGPKMHCSNLAAEGLKRAIKDYKTRK